MFISQLTLTVKKCTKIDIKIILLKILELETEYIYKELLIQQTIINSVEIE